MVTHSSTEISGPTSAADRTAALQDVLREAPRVDTAGRETVLAWAARLQRLGLYVFPVQAGAKLPATAHGYQDGTTDPETLAAVYTQGMNLGVWLGASGLVVIDADTPAEVDALRAWWRSVARGTALPDPTVSTPGNRDGHHGGGHWWTVADGVDLREVPEMDLAAPGAEDGSPTATAKTGRRYVLLPGSVRTDAVDPGQPAYRVTGEVQHNRAGSPGVVTTVVRAGEKLAQAQARVRERNEHYREHVAGRGGVIDEWTEATPWSEILEPHGWKLATTLARCGCENWSRPGKSDGSKSATAHDRYTCTADMGNVLKVFSDNAAPLAPVRDTGQGGYSKLDAYAALEHDGDTGAAMEDLGLVTGQFLDPADIDPSTWPEGWAEKWERGLETLQAHQAAAANLRAVDTGLDDSELWTARPWLAEVKRLAWLKVTDPYALLLVVLSEVALRVPPQYILASPSDVSLNLFTMLLAGSSEGKGTTSKLGRKLVAHDFRGEVEITSINGWSGQGMGKVFTWRGKGEQPDDWKPPHVRFIDSEASKLINLAKSESSTHFAALNGMFMGEEQGAGNSEESRFWQLAAHTGRGCVQLEAQDPVVAPLMSGDALDTGLTARLLLARPWLPAAARWEWKRQRDAGLLEDRHADPEPVVTVNPDNFPRIRRADGLVPFPTAPEVLNLLEDARLGLGGDRDGLTAHEGLRRRKVATLMAIASGEAEVTMEWWHLAGYVMANHRAVIRQWRKDHGAREREAVVAKLAEAASREDEARAQKMEADLDRVVEWLRALDPQHRDPEGWVKWSLVRSNGPGRRWTNDHRDKVRQTLEDDPRVEVEEVARGHRLRLTA